MHGKDYFIPECKGGKWQTTEEIRISIGKGSDWVWISLKAFRKMRKVCRRLPHMNYGKSTPYFAPCVIRALKLEAYGLVQPANGWLTRHEIERRLQITWRIAEKVLEPFLGMTEPRLDSHNRPRPHFPPEILQSL